PAPGSRLLVRPDGTLEGTFEIEALDAAAMEEALGALRDERSRMASMPGGVEAFVEVLRPPIRLLVCGAGHDAIPLVRFGAALGWRVDVIDDRMQFLKERRFPEASRLIQAEPIDAADQAGVDDQ